MKNEITADKAEKLVELLKQLPPELKLRAEGILEGMALVAKTSGEEKSA